MAIRKTDKRERAACEFGTCGSSWWALRIIGYRLRHPSGSLLAGINVLLTYLKTHCPRNAIISEQKNIWKKKEEHRKKREVICIGQGEIRIKDDPSNSNTQPHMHQLYLHQSVRFCPCGKMLLPQTMAWLHHLIHHELRAGYKFELCPTNFFFHIFSWSSLHISHSPPPPQNLFTMTDRPTYASNFPFLFASN